MPPSSARTAREGEVKVKALNEAVQKLSGEVIVGNHCIHMYVCMYVQ